MFQLNQVACAYEQKKVFTGLDLEIRQGQYVMLMGENGTGKSSLISLLTGFKQAESGRILFLGKDLKEWLKDKRQKRDFYSRLGILFQDVDSQLFNSTVYDEIAFGPRQLGLTEEEVSQRVQDTLSLLKIEDLRDRVPYQLSGGEKKKVAFASIMVTNPDVYILDEPFNNLSKEYEEFFRELLHDLHSAGKTIIMSAHHFKHLHHEKSDVLLFEDDKADFFPAQEVLSNQQVVERLSHY